MGAADGTELGRHGCLLPLYPEAIGFVGRYGFGIKALLGATAQQYFPSVTQRSSDNAVPTAEVLARPV